MPCKSVTTRATVSSDHWPAIATKGHARLGREDTDPPAYPGSSTACAKTGRMGSMRMRKAHQAQILGFQGRFQGHSVMPL